MERKDKNKKHAGRAISIEEINDFKQNPIFLIDEDIYGIYDTVQKTSNEYFTRTSENYDNSIGNSENGLNRS